VLAMSLRPDFFHSLPREREIRLLVGSAGIDRPFRSSRHDMMNCPNSGLCNENFQQGRR
jgi:hypothetical protein